MLSLLSALMLAASSGAAVKAASVSASAIPTYPADATDVTAVSAIQATATPAPNLGNPDQLSSYPLCAQTCNNESMGIYNADLSNIENLCGPTFRSITSACQQLTCNAEDRETTSVLAEELCGPVYRNSPSLGAAVSSAIASATSVAAAQTTKDPTVGANYPLCAQKCQNATIPSTGCGSLSNRTCICKNPSPDLGNCERATCSPSDIQLISDLANLLCNPVGGITNNATTTTNASSSLSATAGPPAPTAFTGDAAAAAKALLGWSVLGLMGSLGWQFLLS